MAQQPKRAPRPGRTLAVLAVVIAAMYAVMFLTDNTRPRLGLDLQGGTSVILQPRLAEGEGDVPQSSLTEAVDIIRQRVNGLGVTEADVQTQGPNIVVSVPGATSREAVELVASTAELTFRPVLQVAAGAPVPVPTAIPEASADPAATPSSTAATPSTGGNAGGNAVDGNERPGGPARAPGPTDDAGSGSHRRRRAHRACDDRAERSAVGDRDPRAPGGVRRSRLHPAGEPAGRRRPGPRGRSS